MSFNLKSKFDEYHIVKFLFIALQVVAIGLPLYDKYIKPIGLSKEVGIGVSVLCLIGAFISYIRCNVIQRESVQVMEELVGHKIDTQEEE